MEGKRETRETGKKNGILFKFLGNKTGLGLDLLQMRRRVAKKSRSGRSCVSIKSSAYQNCSQKICQR